MLRAHKNNKKNNFIAGWYIEDSLVCDNIIRFYNKNSNYINRGAMGVNGKIDLDKKNSFDLGFDSNDNREPLFSYKKNLSKILELYKNKYKMCSEQQNQWGLYEGYNIQKYPKGGGFPAWHYENTGYGYRINRHLVFMTYLNDVLKDGETEFMYQKIKIKPEKGLTLIWPATWEYTHRGNICPNQEKYIMTGWYSYKDV